MDGQSADQIVLVHVSDTHMGEVLLNHKTRIISGYRCHHVKLCKALWSALPEVRIATGLGDDDPFHVVMSGDLTSLGLPAEFLVGHVFFQHRMPDDYDSQIDFTGLGLPLSRLSMVPGNHDHWHGQWVYPLQRGYSPKLTPWHFQTTPWLLPICSTQGGIQLDLIGIDSNSGRHCRSFNLNPAASGALSAEESNSLRKALSDSQNTPPVNGNVQHRVRAIVSHHSLSRDGTAKALDAASTKELLSMAAHAGVSVVLTGHTHKAHQWKYGPPNLSRHVWEIRSPTTLQAPAKRRKAALSPGFWVHQIGVEKNPRELNWAAKLFLFHRGRFCWSSEEEWFKFPIDLHS